MNVLTTILNNEEYNTVSVMGLKGSGKTYGLVVMAKQIEKRVFIFDTLGAISRNQLIKGKSVIYVRMAKLPEGKLRRHFDQFYISKAHYIVFDLSDMIPEELVYFGDVFSTWAIKKGNMAVIIDEIVDYCPQSGSPYSIDIQRLWRAGRNYGIYPVIMATQRPQEADKKILAHAQIYFIMKLANDLDLAKIKALIPNRYLTTGNWEDLEDKIAQLPQRHVVVYDTVRGTIENFVFPDVTAIAGGEQDEETRS